MARPSALLNGLNYEIGPALIWTVLAGALAAGAMSFHTFSSGRWPIRLLWAAGAAFAVLGAIIPGAMLLGDDRMMVAVLAGSTVLSSTVPFLLLWAAYALLCAIRSNLTTLQLFAALRRGLDAGLIAVAIA